MEFSLKELDGFSDANASINPSIEIEDDDSGFDETPHQDCPFIASFKVVHY
jgi:hypothetical protein